ncbi:hypothetical protein NHF45_08835 [Maricaulaceae bacterium NA33B04]|nr:hypothetical protein [Maricaulaceae bacterium NA33B04]
MIHASPSIWGGPSENQSFNPVVSHDGRRVAFVSFATDLVSATDGLSSISRNVFVFDRITGQVEMVSASPTGDAGNHAADLELSFSPDGNRLVFATKADNLHPNDTEGDTDIYIYDFVTNQLSHIEPSVITNLPAPNGLSHAREPSFSGAGNEITYIQQLDFGLPGAAPTVVHDLDTNTAEIISVTPSGVFANGSSDQPIFSDDGTAVYSSRQPITFIPTTPTGTIVFT